MLRKRVLQAHRARQRSRSRMHLSPGNLDIVLISIVVLISIATDCQNRLPENEGSTPAPGGSQASSPGQHHPGSQMFLPFLWKG